MTPHILHLTVKARIQPTQQMLLVGGDFDAGDAELAEPEAVGEGGQLEFGRVRVDGLRIIHNVFTAASIMPYGFANRSVLHRASTRPRQSRHQRAGNSRLYLDEA